MFALAALALTVAVQQGLLAWLDVAVREWVATVRTGQGLALMVCISRISSEQVTPVVVIVIGLLIARHSRAWARYLVVVTGTSVLWHVALKPLLDRPRPQPPLLPYWPGPGYPSGHALSTLCLALALAWWFQQRHHRPDAVGRVTAVLLAAWVLLVGLSRIYVDAHWLTDVLGGYIIGLAHFLGSVWICGGAAQATGEGPAEVVGHT